MSNQNLNKYAYYYQCCLHWRTTKLNGAQQAIFFAYLGTKTCVRYFSKPGQFLQKKLTIKTKLPNKLFLLYKHFSYRRSKILLKLWNKKKFNFVNTKEIDQNVIGLKYSNLLKRIFNFLTEKKKMNINNPTLFTI